jgi:hypothetical protein
MARVEGMEDWARLASPLVERPNPSKLITMVRGKLASVVP